MNKTLEMEQKASLTMRDFELPVHRILGDVLSAYALQTGISCRDFAKEIGVSSATMHRLQKGSACDSQTITKVLLWLLETK